MSDESERLVPRDAPRSFRVPPSAVKIAPHAPPAPRPVEFKAREIRFIPAPPSKHSAELAESLAWADRAIQEVTVIKDVDLRPSARRAMPVDADSREVGARRCSTCQDMVLVGTDEICNSPIMQPPRPCRAHREADGPDGGLKFRDGWARCGPAGRFWIQATDSKMVEREEQRARLHKPAMAKPWRSDRLLEVALIVAGAFAIVGLYTVGRWIFLLKDHIVATW